MIYVLQLQGGHYYVGSTSDLRRRYQEHQNGTGAEFTRRFPPMNIFETRPSSGPFSEDAVVKEMMARFGIDRVRGGSYSTVALSSVQRLALTQEIRGASNSCFKCGGNDHWAANCNRVYTDVFSEFDSESELESWESEPESDGEDDGCFRCGRSGHWANRCYAARDVNGRVLN